MAFQSQLFAFRSPNSTHYSMQSNRSRSRNAESFNQAQSPIRLSESSPLESGRIDSFGHNMSISPITQSFTATHSPFADGSSSSFAQRIATARSFDMNDSASIAVGPQLSFSRKSRMSILPEISNASYYQRNTTQEERLRILRYEAHQHHLTDAAIFYAEKLLATTDDINDVYCLAEAYYQSGKYERALDLLNKKSTLNKSVQCRYLAGLCAIAMENWRDALDYLGLDNPFAEKDFKHDQVLEGTIKLEAIMCYARGKAYMNLKEVEKARSCFKEALLVDVRCYDALEALVSHNMMDEKSEWEFITTLPYEEVCGNDADLFRSLYTLELKRYSHSADIAQAQKKAEVDYNLSQSIDVMHSTAKTYLSESRYEECLQVCQEIRKQDALYLKHIPLYLTSMFELQMKTGLYEFAQELVDRLNSEAITWHAVGMYYLFIKQYADARRYFNQATIMDQYLEPAWICLGHAYAAEKDYEKSISTYSLCSHLIPGSHFPYMYIGMQYMEQNISDMALDYYKKSYNICSSDPFLMNEFGTLYYYKEDYHQAQKYLRKALKLAKARLSPRCVLWEKLWANLGHVYRQLKLYDRALRCFYLALQRNPRNFDAHAAMGMIYHLKGEYSKAIQEYNTASKLNDSNQLVHELLDKVLQSSINIPSANAMERHTGTDDIFGTNRPKLSLEECIEVEIIALSEGENSAGDDELGSPIALDMARDASDDPFLIDEGDLRPNMAKEWL